MLEIANALLPSQQKQKKMSTEKEKREKKTKMSFYSIERGWSLSYTVFSIIIVVGGGGGGGVVDVIVIVVDGSLRLLFVRAPPNIVH